MNVRRIIAAAISTLALIAVNVGMVDSASAGTQWADSPSKSSKVKTFGTQW